MQDAPNWTDPEDELLRHYWAEGLKVKEIAERMGNRSYSAVGSRATKLGLYRKGTKLISARTLRRRESEVKRSKWVRELSTAEEAKKNAEVERRLRILEVGYGKTVAEVVAETGYPADEVERELKYLVRGRFFVVRDGRHLPPHAYERGRKAS